MTRTYKTILLGMALTTASACSVQTSEDGTQIAAPSATAKDLGEPSQAPAPAAAGQRALEAIPAADIVAMPTGIDPETVLQWSSSMARCGVGEDVVGDIDPAVLMAAVPPASRAAAIQHTLLTQPLTNASVAPLVRLLVSTNDPKVPHYLSTVYENARAMADSNLRGRSTDDAMLSAISEAFYDKEVWKTRASVLDEGRELPPNQQITAMMRRGLEDSAPRVRIAAAAGLSHYGQLRSAELREVRASLGDDDQERLVQALAP